MRKIKYQGTITKFLTTRKARRHKKRFMALSANELMKMIGQFDKRKADYELVSMSSNRDYGDQVLSILSFLRYMGTPISWTIYSDGTHTDQQIKDLQEIFPFVRIDSIDFSNREEVLSRTKESCKPYFEELLHYAQYSAIGKKTFYYLNHVVENPTLFLDSDIVFYLLSSDAFERISHEKPNSWYLAEYQWGCLDSTYIKNHPRQVYQVNAGLFLLHKDLENIHLGLDYLRSLNFEYEYFTEQTILHIIFKNNNFQILDPRIFILTNADQFDFSLFQDRNSMAARHYTGTVRHKMWQRDWKWHLSLDLLD